MYGLGYDGFEIDMLSLGDADCLVVTEWNPSFGPWRVLIDGGKGTDADHVKDFLLKRGYTHFYAVVCTHAHEDHAGGLIKIVQDLRFSFTSAWMHDIRRHVDADALRRASSGSSSEAKEVKQVVETTRELSSAFSSRYLVPQEPFVGSIISSSWPRLVVLGPSLGFYKKVLADFTKIEEPYPFSAALMAALSGQRNLSSLSSLALPSSNAPAPYPFPPSIFSGSSTAGLGGPVPLTGLLGNSSVKKNPNTQPFNNTSVILGSVFKNNQILFTADAGADALDCVAPEWKSLTWMQVPHHGSDGNLSQKNVERFHPKWAYISACGDSSHPSRAIVSGLIKAGAQVFSTHQSGSLQFFIGNVPYRADYSAAVPLKGTGSPEPVIDWAKLWSANR